MTEKPKAPRRPPIEAITHESTAPVDLFLFTERRIAELVFPPALRPESVLVLSCSSDHRDMLRGRAVRNFYDLIGEEGAYQRSANAFRQLIRDRMLSYGSIVDVADDWPGLRNAGSKTKVGELLELLHRAFTLSKSGDRPTVEEMRAIMEGKHVH